MNRIDKLMIGLKHNGFTLDLLDIVQHEPRIVEHCRVMSTMFVLHIDDNTTVKQVNNLVDSVRQALDKHQLLTGSDLVTTYCTDGVSIIIKDK